MPRATDQTLPPPPEQGHTDTESTMAASASLPKTQQLNSGKDGSRKEDMGMQTHRIHVCMCDMAHLTLDETYKPNTGKNIEGGDGLILES